MSLVSAKRQIEDVWEIVWAQDVATTVRLGRVRVCGEGVRRCAREGDDLGSEHREAETNYEVDTFSEMTLP